MFDMQRVLVPVDMSACSRHALEYALRFAQRLDAEVEILHVYEPPDDFVPRIAIAEPAGERSTAYEFAHKEARRELKTFLSDLEPFDSLKPIVSLVAGDPKEEILCRARSGRYGVIIMGTHGRTGLARFLLGSIAEEVIRRSPCPVLTTRPPTVAELTTRAPMSIGARAP